MARQEPPRPTEAELAILRVLWREGPCTVRTIQQVMSREQPTGYTTVLKLLQIMTGKGLVVRDESRSGRTCTGPAGTRLAPRSNWSETCSIGPSAARPPGW